MIQKERDENRPGRRRRKEKKSRFRNFFAVQHNKWSDLKEDKDGHEVYLRTRTPKNKTKQNKNIEEIARLGPRVIQSHADGGLLVTRVSADGLALLEVPETSNMI